MVLKKIKEKIVNKGISVACSAVGNTSDENLIQLLEQMKKWNERLSKVTGKEFYGKDIGALIDGLNGKRERNPTLNLFKAVLALKSENARNSFIRNVVWNSGLYGKKRRLDFQERNGFKSPYFLTISPTSDCNLRCNGCYAGLYEKETLDFETVDRIIKEGKEIGTSFYVLSGGEIFMWPSTFEILKKHNDAYFLIYTNGTLIDKEKAKKLESLGNSAIAISVEGFERDTDERRGKGTSIKILRAMENLRDAGILFGISAMATRQNTEKIVSEDFIDYYFDKGCRFGWYFQFLPVGKNPDVENMALPEQRVYLRKKIKEIRESKKDFYIGDFWNDGVLMDGCLAGGRNYISINAKGDVEPCAFVHFAVDNIKGKSLEEVLNSEFFQEIRKRQPYSTNLYAPCMIIDNPWVLREIVEKTNAKPTHCNAECIIKDEKIKNYLDNYSRKIHELTDGLNNPFKVE